MFTSTISNKNIVILVEVNNLRIIEDNSKTTAPILIKLKWDQVESTKISNKNIIKIGSSKTVLK